MAGAEGQFRVRSGRFSLIDGLRGCAAIAVLFYHYIHFSISGPDHGFYLAYRDNQPFRGLFAFLYDYGFYAVELFWMISGFVFAAVYFGRNAETREFVLNRFARLYPLHFLTLIVIAGLQMFALRRFGHTLVFDNFDLQHFIAQLFFASDWLESSGHSFNVPVWSVSVEVVVYALFWLLREPLGRMGPIGFAAVIGLSLMASMLGTFSRIPTCAFYFFSGSALYRAYRHLSVRPRLLFAVSSGFLLGGLAGLADGSALIREIVSLPLLGSAAILSLAALEQRAASGLQAIAEWIGDCTYGIYLWHVPLQLALMLLLLPAIDPARLTAQAWFLPVWICGVVIWARISFVVFERPMRERIRRFGKSRRSVVPAYAV